MNAANPAPVLTSSGALHIPYRDPDDPETRRWVILDRPETLVAPIRGALLTPHPNPGHEASVDFVRVYCVEPLSYGAGGDVARIELVTDYPFESDRDGVPLADNVYVEGELWDRFLGVDPGGPEQ